MDSQGALSAHPVPTGATVWRVWGSFLEERPEARVFLRLGREGRRSLSLLWAQTETTHSGSIRNTWCAPTAAASSSRPLVVALGPGHAPQEPQTKGDCPPFVKRAEALLEDYLSQTQPPSLLPSRLG